MENSDHYNGKLYVLIKDESGSMAAVVTSFPKGSGRGIFTGEESGGTIERSTSHQTARPVLPQSIIWIAMAFCSPRDGRYPDYEVTPKIDNVLNCVDTELNFALRLIP